MALGREDERTLFASPNTPDDSQVGEFIDIDPRSELIFETPPPDVVSSINECFEEFNSTFKKTPDTSHHKHSSDSDSGESLFVTQSVKKATQIEKKHRSFERPKSVCDDSVDDTERVRERILSEVQDTEFEEGNRRRRALLRKKRKSDFYVSARKATFPFLLKSIRQEHLSTRKHQILENSEIGGFLKCIKKIEEGCPNTRRTLSPYMQESEISDNSEDDEHNSDHEVIIVEKSTFVPGYFKGNRIKWLPQSILNRRIQENNELKDKEKGKMKKTTSTKKKNDSVKKARNNHRGKASVMTSESPGVSFLKEQDKQQETDTILASCSDAELSDFSYCVQPPIKQVVQFAESSYEDHIMVIEDTQRNSLEEVADASDHLEDEHDVSSDNQPDHFHLNKSSLVLPPQEGDITIQYDETNSEIVSVDLLGPLDSPKHNQIPKAPSFTANMEDSNEDSDATLIETGDQFVSPFGQGTLRWFKGESPANEDNNSDETQIEADQIPKAASFTANMEDSNEDSDATLIETGDQFVSPFGQGTLRWFEGDSTANEGNNSDETQIEAEDESAYLFGFRAVNQQFTIQDITSKNIEAQNTSQKLEPKIDIQVKHKNKKETMSNYNTEVPGVEVTVNVQPSSKLLPLSDEPLGEVYSGSSESVIVGRQKVILEMETDSPLFKYNGPSFLKIKRKRKEKKGAADLIQSDANVDVGHIVSCEPLDDDIIEPKTTHTGNIESCEGQNRRTNWEQTDGLQSEETAEPLEKSTLSTVMDNSVKMRKHKLKECVDAEISFQTVQFGDSQTAELTSKKAKKKRKNKEIYTEENIAADSTLNGSIDSEILADFNGVNKLNQSSEAPETVHPKHMQMSEDTTGCSLPCAYRLKKRKKKDRADETLYESIDLDTACESNFDTGLKIVEQQEDRVSEERHEIEHLQVKVKLKSKKKSLKANFQDNDITKLENQRSDSQSNSSVEAANFGSDGMVVTTYKKKKHKSKGQNGTEHSSYIDNNVQYSELQTIDSLSKGTEKKKAKKDRKRTAVGSIDELLDDGLPVIGENHAIETNQLDHSQTLEDMSRCSSPSSRKKKKKKRDRSQKHQYESVDLNLLRFNDVSGFNMTAKEGWTATQKLTEERLSNETGAESLEGNASSILTDSKHKNKSHNVCSLYQTDAVIRTKRTASDLESGDTAEVVGTNNSSVLSSCMYNSKRKKKKHKLKEQNGTEVSSDIDNNVQYSEPQTTELLSKRTEKRKANEDMKRRTVGSSNELLGHMDDGLSEIGENKAIETNQLDHSQVLEEMTRCSSPISRKKKKKKRDRSQKHQYESVDAEILESNATNILMNSKHKKKSHNLSSSCQIDEFVRTKIPAPDLESRNTAELVETINSSVLLNSTYNGKKKKQKLKENENAEPEQFNDSRMTELTTKRRKKKKKDKERTQPTNVEENGLADIQSNYYFGAPQTDQLERLQTSDETTQIIKSAKKKKKKKRDDILCESVGLDGSSVSQIDNKTDRSITKETTDGRPNDGVERVENNADADLNYSYYKKKKKQSLSGNGDSDYHSSAVELHEFVTPRRKKKKRNSDEGGELIQERSDLATPLENSQSPMLNSPEVISKKPKTKANKERNGEISHVIDYSAEPENVQTKNDSLMQYNVANNQDSTDIRKKKKKKKKKDAERNS